MSEARLWKTLKEGMDHTGHFDRIESHATAQGRPDVSYCIDGREGNIELKVFDPRRGGFILRASQNSWFCKHHKAGSERAFILARYDLSSHGIIYLLIRGEESRNLIHDRSFETWKSLACQIWTDRINWSELKAVLKGTGLVPASPN